MDKGTFMDIIGVHYKELKVLCKSRLYNIDIPFDEDLFNDTFIKCAQRFGNTEITYETCIKYFWTAYLNTIKSEKNNHKHIDTVSLDEDLHDCIDEDDNQYAINVYNIVMDAISERFGEEDMMIYSLYKYHGWSKEDLTFEGYDCDDFDNRIKTIHKFVKTYCKKHITQ